MGDADVSLLDGTNESVLVYLETWNVDTDGNTITKPSVTGIEIRAWISPISYRGGGFPESLDGGFISSTRYGLRFPRSFTEVLGAQSQVEWNGNRYSVVGDPVVNNGSPRTRHVHYTIERA